MSNWDPHDLGGDDPIDLEAQYRWSQREQKAAGDPGDEHVVASERSMLDQPRKGKMGRDVVDAVSGEVGRDQAEGQVARANAWQEKQRRATANGMTDYANSYESKNAVMHKDMRDNNHPDDHAYVSGMYDRANRERAGRTFPKMDIPGEAGEPHSAATSTIRGWPKNEGPRR